MAAKLFATIKTDLDDTLEQSLVDALASVVLSFSLLCTPGPTVALYALHVREQGGVWRNVIPTVLSDNDGEISTLVGSFAPGTQLDVFFGVMAVTDAVAKAATFAIRDAATPYKLAPASPTEYKSLARGERWETTVPYRVPGATA